MAEVKLIIGQKDGKCVQKVLGEEAKQFLGKTIGDAVKGDDIGLAGYEFLITGGSDNCGFPMRKDLPGTGRKRILIVPGSTGVRKKSKSKKARLRKTVMGNTISSQTAQINVKVIKEGKQPLAAPAEAEKVEEKPQAEKKAEEKAEPVEKKAEEKPKAEKPKAPKEEAKENPPAEKKPAEEKKAEEKPEKPAEKSAEKKE